MILYSTEVLQWTTNFVSFRTMRGLHLTNEEKEFMYRSMIQYNLSPEEVFNLKFGGDSTRVTVQYLVSRVFVM